MFDTHEIQNCNSNVTVVKPQNIHGNIHIRINLALPLNIQGNPKFAIHRKLFKVISFKKHALYIKPV